MTEPKSFEIDIQRLYWELNPIVICVVCKNRDKCPLHWECETIANLDNDYTDHGDDEA